jgi:crotonobetainyl-CoA:carnitine CoA-transferase CaiB-like acyl-CoA transferase
MEGPLAGVTVADFTWAGVGGYCGLLWAMLGADVIKIETKVRGGTQRASNPARRIGVKSNLAEELSRNKKSVLLNLKTDAGVRLAREIVSRSDLTAENFRPGVMDRLGLGYRDLVRVRPGIVMVSMAANGQTGPDRGIPGYAGIFGALSGLSSLMGYAGGPPAELRLPSDMLAGTMGAVAGVAGLYRRRVTGQGQYIDCANRESLGTLIGEYFIAASVGREQTRAGNDVLGRAPYNCYRCADDPAAAGGGTEAERERWLAIGITRDEQWAALAGVLDLGEVAGDPALATAGGRWARRAAIDAAIAAQARTRPAGELERALQAAGVPAGVVMRPDDLLADPHLTERGQWDVLDRPDALPWLTFGVPVRFERAGAAAPYPAPPLGADSTSVLTGLLGYSEDEVAGLVAAEVVA